MPGFFGVMETEVEACLSEGERGERPLGGVPVVGLGDGGQGLAVSVGGDEEQFEGIGVDGWTDES